MTVMRFAVQNDQPVCGSSSVQANQQRTAVEVIVLMPVEIPSRMSQFIG
jgi:hypothetical protein